jgi:polyphosphate kinase
MFDLDEEPRAGQVRNLASSARSRKICGSLEDPAIMSEAAFIDGSRAPGDRLGEHSLYFNREISWLAFNRRVLEEATDPAWPLLERLKFLAIFHSNLDEFFMIRVSGLHEQREASVIERSADGLSVEEQLRLVREIVLRDTATAMQTLREELHPRLAEAGIRILDWSEIEPDRQERLSAYFESAVFPVLTPLAFDPAHPFPFISNLSLSLAVEVADKQERRPAFARVKVPASFDRFVPVPGAPDRFLDFVPLEKLVEANLDRLFPGMEILGASSFRVTRDADIEIREDEAGDLLRSMADNLRRRRFGDAVRLEVEDRCPQAVRDLLRRQLELDPDDVYPVGGPLGAADLLSLVKLDLPALKDPPMLPSSRTIFDVPGGAFDMIAKGDVLLHHPYDSFDPVLQFLEEAADDPDVLAIKMSLYRVGADSPVVAALARAAENRKQVAVLVELKARFDEENNIQWARSLERAGVHVAYGVEGLKTHAKLALVVRREGETIRRYVHVGTGNYNRFTARVYTDIALFTTHPEFAHDASELFNFLTGFSKKTRYRRLSVAPSTLHDRVLRLIDREAEKARGGQPAAIVAKMNALVDSSVIRALYRASQAGVPIDLSVRGICCLRPGVPGVSDTIRVSSVVGRFLEHSRAFAFGLDEEQEIYIASADWMPRNFYRRVELMVPILDERAKAKVRDEILNPILADNCRARDLQADGAYVRRRPAPGEILADTQQDLIDLLGRRGLKAVSSQ